MRMYKKVQMIMLSVLGVLIAVVAIGLLISGGNNKEDDSAAISSSNIFEEVSNLEALEMGGLDGDTLRKEHGIDTSEVTGSTEGGYDNAPASNVVVSISLRSIQDDIKIKFFNSSTEKLIASVPFTVTLKGKDKTMTYSDIDMDGIIYIPFVEAGDYTVFMSDITVKNVNYTAEKSQVITVSDSIEYTKVDIKDEIKTEAQIDVASEDTKVQDEDETTIVDETVEDNYEESYDEDISDEAEDLLAQIEQEESEKEALKGASSGTITAPANNVTSDPSYVEAHSGSKGIDVSKHNGTIDWGAVKSSGINFAIIRCGYRGSSSGALVIDPMYAANMAGAQGAGINVGVYFFSQAVNEAEAVEEASMVLELVSGYSLQMPVYLDVEKSRGRGDTISTEQRTAVCNAFLSTIRNAGYTAGIYSNKLWFEEKINTAAFADYKIWLAQYVDIPTYTRTRYDMWQYTSKGSISGISGNVDMNVLK